MQQTQKKSSVSIVIPVYNEERCLAACLDSIAQQTVMPDEVIVVDNNSTDRTVHIAEQYPFVRVIYEPQQGRVYARDAGFNAAHTDIIGRIDADTVLPKKWVAYVADFYTDPAHLHNVWTGGGYFYNTSIGNLLGWWQGQIAYRVNRLLMGHYILWGSNMAIPRAIWQQVRTEVCHRNDIHEDLDLAIHIHRMKYDITYHEGLKVGVEMRRVLANRRELWENLQWWPRTLRVHQNRMWLFGFVGALCLYSMWPLLWIVEKISRVAT